MKIWHTKAWWKGKEKFKKRFPSDMRREIFNSIPCDNNEKYTYNGSGFNNEHNTKWASSGVIRKEIIMNAPHLRREILPHELVIDIDADNEQHMIKRSRMIKATLDVLEIPHLVAFSGNRGFHFHIMIHPRQDIPKEHIWMLVKGMNFLKMSILHKICEYAGYSAVDMGSSGAKGKRHAIQELYSINYKSKCYVLPMDDITVERCMFPEEPPHRDIAIPLWSFNDDQWELISEKARELIKSEVKSKPMITSIYVPGRPKKKTNKSSKNKTNDNDWKEKRLIYYAKVLKEHSRLEKDKKILERHGGKDYGAEHMARLHLVFLCIGCGYTDDQIHDIFQHADDYDRSKTQYFIEYNRDKFKTNGDNK